MQRTPEDIDLRLRIEEVVSLNRYTIEARYPGGWEPFNRKEAEKAVAIARKVRRAVKEFLPNEME